MKLTAAIAALIMTATPSFAAQNCGQRGAVIQQLADKYSETLKVGGLQKVQGAQVLMEIWASPETGTFTVLLTKPDGAACIVAAGTDWFEVEPIPVEDEAG